MNTNVNDNKKLNNEKQNKKTNDILASINDLKKLFTECDIIAKYSDGINYVGCGSRCNTFSVNLKKTKYNVFCDNVNFEKIENAKINDTNIKLTKNGNLVDKVRPNYIECKTTAALKKLLKIIKNDSIAIVK